MFFNKAKGRGGLRLGHFGLALLIVGASVEGTYSERLELAMAPGQSAKLAGYTFTFLGEEQLEGPNYRAERGRFLAVAKGGTSKFLAAEKRLYLEGGQLITEAAISPGLWRDLYITIGDRLEGQQRAVNLAVVPMVRWIWAGAALIALAAFWGTASAVRRRLGARRLAGAPKAAALGGVASRQI